MERAMFGIPMPKAATEVAPFRHLTPLLSLNFRLARRHVHLGVSPDLAVDGGRLQAEVDAAHSGHGWTGHRPGLPLHLVRKPISPAVLQLWYNDR